MQCLSVKINCNAIRAFHAFIINAHYNHTGNVNGVTFVTRKHMSPEGPIFLFLFAVTTINLINSKLFFYTYDANIQ